MERVIRTLSDGEDSATALYLEPLTFVETV